MDEKTLKIIASELGTIKKLLILDLAKNGTSLTKIAKALDMDKRTVARLFPKGSVNEVTKAK